MQRNVTRVRADYFSRALAIIGASVEVRDKQGQLIAAQAPEPTAGAAEPIARWLDPPNRRASASIGGAAASLGSISSPAPNPWIDPMSRTIAQARR